MVVEICIIKMKTHGPKKNPCKGKRGREGLHFVAQRGEKRKKRKHLKTIRR